MPKVQLLQEWEHEGTHRQPGDVLEVPEPVAFDLIVTGRARDHSDPGPTETKVVSPEETK